MPKLLTMLCRPTDVCRSDLLDTAFLTGLIIAVLQTAGCKPVDSAGGGANSEEIEPLQVITTESGVQQLVVPAGSFEIGSGVGDEGPRQSISVSAFAMDQYEVLQEELTRLQVPDASHFKDPRRPVEMVRWSEAAMLCNERSRAEGLQPCYDELTFECDFSADGYRLPTEAEWEYAARAGDVSPHAPEKPVDKLMAKACYSGNSGKKTAVAGSHQPNAWGFYDLQGNVAEWCNDIYAETAYKSIASQDPVGPSEGKKRVLRGGSWKSDEDACRVTARWADEPGIDDACFAQDSYGFRMVRRWVPDGQGSGSNSSAETEPEPTQD